MKRKQGLGTEPCGTPISTLTNYMKFTYINTSSFTVKRSIVHLYFRLKPDFVGDVKMLQSQQLFQRKRKSFWLSNLW